MLLDKLKSQRQNEHVRHFRLVGALNDVAEIVGSDTIAEIKGETPEVDADTGLSAPLHRVGLPRVIPLIVPNLEIEARSKGQPELEILIVDEMVA